VDLNTVNAVVRPRTRAALPAWAAGDAFVAGGTWMFSEPQVGVTRLVDLMALRWPSLSLGDAGLDIAATCKLAELESFEAPEEWRAAPVIGQCCRSLLGSFKIRRVATVGGNLCLALPAAPMAALAVAMHGTCIIWDEAGGQREIPADGLINGAGQTVLRHGEILRSVTLPLKILRRRAAFRQMSLTAHGRSAALLIGTRVLGGVELTMTGAVPLPVRVTLAEGMHGEALAQAIDAAVPCWFDDVHGRPKWRRRITHLMAAEITRDLLA